MAKTNLDDMTVEELELYREQVAADIETLKKVIEASNTTVFDLLINEVKEDMKNNVIEEEWKMLKENKNKIESYRNVIKTLQNQENLLDRKENELQDIENKLKFIQQNLFKEEELHGEPTGYLLSGGDRIMTGDTFELAGREESYVLIKKSAEIEGSFCMVGNKFEGERCLQYPANLKLLEGAIYFGNIYAPEYTSEYQTAIEIAHKILDEEISDK